MEELAMPCSCGHPTLVLHTWSPGDDARNGHLVKATCPNCGRETGTYDHSRRHEAEAEFHVLKAEERDQGSRPGA
jgi:hypothetical protein